MTLWDDVAAERRAIADLLDTLTPEQWETPSLCGAWTVRDLAAHLVMPHTAGCTTLVLSSLPPSPTSTTAHSTFCSAKY